MVEVGGLRSRLLIICLMLPPAVLLLYKKELGIQKTKKIFVSDFSAICDVTLLFHRCRSQGGVLAVALSSSLSDVAFSRAHDITDFIAASTSPRSSQKATLSCSGNG